MNGKMLWFNADKGYGFIQTEDDERLYVAIDGFQPGEAPVGRCAGREVVFERQTDATAPRAISVTFTPDAAPRRARRRHGGRSSNL